MQHRGVESTDCCEGVERDENFLSIKKDILACEVRSKK